jgi:hypothetical protein
MAVGDDPLRDVLVQKCTVARTLARPSHASGRVVGIVPSTLGNTSERNYRVVYEDGDEAILPESEVCTWLIKHGSHLAKPGIAQRPSVLVSPGPLIYATTDGARRLCNVVGPAPRRHGRRPETIVVFDDGEERVLPTAEVQMLSTPTSTRMPYTRTPTFSDMSFEMATGSTTTLNVSTTTTCNVPLACPDAQLLRSSRQIDLAKNIVPIRFDSPQAWGPLRTRPPTMAPTPEVQWASRTYDHCFELSAGSLWEFAVRVHANASRIVLFVLVACFAVWLIVRFYHGALLRNPARNTRLSSERVEVVMDMPISWVPSFLSVDYFQMSLETLFENTLSMGVLFGVLCLFVRYFLCICWHFFSVCSDSLNYLLMRLTHVPCACTSPYHYGHSCWLW